MICSIYGDCTIPFYECTFSIPGILFPFTASEIEVLKHLVISTLQLHPVSWAYVKVYKYQWKYLKGKPFVTLFFNFYKCCRGSVTQKRSKRLIYMEPNVWGFRPLLELQHYNGLFFLVTHIRVEAHKMNCTVGDRVKSRCTEMLPTYWR